MRVEQIGRATLYLGDNALVRELLPADAALVTDPPYGIAHTTRAGGGGKHHRRNHSRPVHGDAAPFDPTPWLAFAEVILWGANHYAARLPRGRWLAWDKLAGLPAFDSFSDVEFAWMNGAGKDRIFSHLWKGICQASAPGTPRFHPTQKPVALMAWCLGLLTDSSRTVADPFMGSGSTGVAAVAAGRAFIGCEIDPEFFDIACCRLELEQRQGNLFHPPAPKEAPRHA